MHWRGSGSSMQWRGTPVGSQLSARLVLLGLVLDPQKQVQVAQRLLDPFVALARGFIAHRVVFHSPERPGTPGVRPAR